MKEIKAGILVLLLFTGFLGYAQKINSPYSRYGLGILHGKNVNTPLRAMGGISIGVWNPTLINPGNPASYGKFDSTAIIFEVGVIGNFTNLTNSVQSESSSFATLSYVFVGFPITKWWRSSLGVLPYSKVGYDVKVIVPIENFSDVTNQFNGDGGLNRFFWGNAFNIGKNLRVGIDADFLFGEANRNSVIYFPDSLLIFGTKTQSSTRGSDFIFDYGLQYDFHLKNDRLLTLGLIYSNTFYLKAKREYSAYTFTGGVDDVEYIRDTIVYEPEEEGLVILPDKVGVGFMYAEKDRWLIGADFEWQNWEKFESFGNTDSLTNAWRISIGGQFIPKHTSISSLFKRMAYRVGFRYESSYLNIFGNQINEYGISFGFGFPMRKSNTELDLSFEAGRRGTTNDGLIQSNYINVTFGVSIHENWFHKRKYR